MVSTLNICVYNKYYIQIAAFAPTYSLDCSDINELHRMKLMITASENVDIFNQKLRKYQTSDNITCYEWKEKIVNITDDVKNYIETYKNC